MSQLEGAPVLPPAAGGAPAAANALQSELLATESPALLVEPSFAWHSSPTLFPAELSLGKVLSEEDGHPEQRATFVFKSEDLPKVMSFFDNQKPGLKAPRGAEAAMGKRRITLLGVVPEGLIPGWVDPRFPPCIETSWYVCQTADMHRHHVAKIVRDSHIDREGGSCVLSCTVRKLVDVDGVSISLMTFEKGKDFHSCTRENLDLLPLTGQRKAIDLGAFVLKHF